MRNSNPWDILEKHWNQDSNINDIEDLKDGAVDAMEEYADNRVADAEEAQAAEYRYDLISEASDETLVDVLIDRMNQYGLDVDPYRIRALLGLGETTLCDTLKEELWEEASEKYTLEELQNRLK